MRHAQLQHYAVRLAILDFAMYHDEITRLDGYLGQVLAALEKQGVAENTFELSGPRG